MPLAKLILTEPFQPAKHVLIQSNPFLIGRGNDCNLILDLTSVSKHHARISFNGEEYSLEDLHSKNGTFLNGNVAIKQPLREKDVITIGGVDLQFRQVRQEQIRNDLESHLSKLRTAMTFSKTLMANPIMDPILDDVMEGLMRLSQAERGFLLLKDDAGELQMARSVNFSSEELKDEKYQLSRTAVERVVKEKKPVAISNAQNDTFFGGQTSVREMELKTLVCVPVLAEDELLGLLYADSNRNEQEFAQLDVEVLELLASNAGVAIENARVNYQVWKVLQEATEVLKEVQEKGSLDNSLQNAVDKALNSFSRVPSKRFPKAKS